MENIRGQYATDNEMLLEDALHTANIYNKDRKFYYEFSKITGEESNTLVVFIKDCNGNVILRQNATYRRDSSIGNLFDDQESRVFERHVFSLCLFMLIQKGLDALSFVSPISSLP